MQHTHQHAHPSHLHNCEDEHVGVCAACTVLPSRFFTVHFVHFVLLFKSLRSVCSLQAVCFELMNCHLLFLTSGAADT